MKRIKKQISGKEKRIEMIQKNKNDQKQNERKTFDPLRKTDEKSKIIIL